MSLRHWLAVGRALAIWVVAGVAGVAVIAVPDTGRPVLTLSDGHGPSAWDLAGKLILLGGWAWFLSALRDSRRAIPHPVILGVAALAG